MSENPELNLVSVSVRAAAGSNLFAPPKVRVLSSNHLIFTNSNTRMAIGLTLT